MTGGDKCRTDHPTEEEKAILLEKAERREYLRNKFWKMYSNPHAQSKGDGGYVFDPSFQRFMSMKDTRYDHFKVTSKTVSYGLFGFLFPLVGIIYALKTSRDQKEARIRNGEVPYRDRIFKLV